MNRVEGDHAVLQHRLRSMQSLSSAKAALKGIETFRAILRGHLDACEPGVLNEIRIARNLSAVCTTVA